MKSNLEQALVACSYRPIHKDKELLYIKVYGFNIIAFDVNREIVSSWFKGIEEIACWNKKEFKEIFDKNDDDISELAKSIQYYERYNGPHDHGNIPENMKDFILIDDYFKQFVFL